MLVIASLASLSKVNIVSVNNGDNKCKYMMVGFSPPLSFRAYATIISKPDLISCRVFVLSIIAEVPNL